MRPAGDFVHGWRPFAADNNGAPNGFTAEPAARQAEAAPSAGSYEAARGDGKRRKATAGKAFGTGVDPVVLPQRQQSTQRMDDMKKALLASAALALLGAAPAAAQQKTIKIGFISTFSGPVAAIGNDMRNALELALDHLGRKIGGLPVEVIYEDDLVKPEVGVQKTQKLIESDKVDFVVGYIWSNVLLASLKPLVDSKTVTIITNAGPSQLAGELCSPYVFSTSWNNDQTPQAVGLYMNQKGVKTAFLMGPNYAAGKDMLEGVASTFKGQVVGRELTRWPDQLDFSAELSKARAAKPDAIFAFYPGGPGIQFITQYAQSGLKGQIPLYTAFVLDELSIPRLKDLAVGIPGAQEWVNDLPNDANKKFVADYKTKYKSSPSFYGAQTYDAVALLDSAVKAVNGDISNKDALRKALEKADFKSVRGNFKFGPNHIPIQNFYLQDVVKDGDDYRLKTVATIVENDQDKHHDKCKMPN
jgi:branched-chain amino acid transport system substrate-binding protein